MVPLGKAAMVLSAILTGEPVLLVDVKIKLHSESELAPSVVGATGFEVHKASL